MRYTVNLRAGRLLLPCRTFARYRDASHYASTLRRATVTIQLSSFERHVIRMLLPVAVIVGSLAVIGHTVASAAGLI